MIIIKKINKLLELKQKTEVFLYLNLMITLTLQIGNLNSEKMRTIYH